MIPQFKHLLLTVTSVYHLLDSLVLVESAHYSFAVGRIDLVSPTEWPPFGCTVWALFGEDLVGAAKNRLTYRRSPTPPAQTLLAIMLAYLRFPTLPAMTLLAIVGAFGRLERNKRGCRHRCVAESKRSCRSRSGSCKDLCIRGLANCCTARSSAEDWNIFGFMTLGS